MAKHTKTTAYSWLASDEELRIQVDQYKSLPWTETFRGAAVIFLAGLLCFSILLGLLGVISLDGGTLTEFAIYAIALYFIFMGHRWAIILAMILWTGDKAYQLYEVFTSGQGNAFVILMWWLLVMPYLFKALKVENLRRRPTASVPVVGMSSEKAHFCRSCGNPLEDSARFCTSCGKAIE